MTQQEGGLNYWGKVNNGKGFPDHILSHQFISTKKNGNGIGLQYLEDCSKKYDFSFRLSNNSFGACVELIFECSRNSIFYSNSSFIKPVTLVAGTNLTNKVKNSSLQMYSFHYDNIPPSELKLSENIFLDTSDESKMIDTFQLIREINPKSEIIIVTEHVHNRRIQKFCSSNGLKIISVECFLNFQNQMNYKLRLGLNTFEKANSLTFA